MYFQLIGGASLVYHIIWLYLVREVLTAWSAFRVLKILLYNWIFWCISLYHQTLEHPQHTEHCLLNGWLAYLVLEVFRISFFFFVPFLHSKGPKFDQPSYPGFERDVFKSVSDYFHSLPQPMLSFQYYELFVNVLGRYEIVHVTWMFV